MWDENKDGRHGLTYQARSQLAEVLFDSALHELFVRELTPSFVLFSHAG